MRGAERAKANLQNRVSGQSLTAAAPAAMRWSEKPFQGGSLVDTLPARLYRFCNQLVISYPLALTL
jgi:hypothetical protein